MGGSLSTANSVGIPFTSMEGSLLMKDLPNVSLNIATLVQFDMIRK